MLCSFVLLLATQLPAQSLGLELRPTAGVEAAKPSLAPDAAYKAAGGPGNTLWVNYMEATRSAVDTWPVNPALKTDRVAVAIFQPGNRVRWFEYVIRASLHRLGPNWALQVFYGREAERERLRVALGSPANVTWTPIELQGERVGGMNKYEGNWFRLQEAFWAAIPEAYEHVLMLEDDSVVLRGGCVDRFLGYDWVGAPWLEEHLQGGNGGFSLRHRSAMLAVVRTPACLLRKGPRPEPGNPKLVTHRIYEDRFAIPILRDLNGTLPNREEAARFAVETVFHPSPCGFHKPWNHFDEETVRSLLATADME